MHKETIIFGIGKYGKQYVKRCADCKVSHIRITDSNKELWGTEYMGISVVVAVSDKYREEIFNELAEQYKVPSKNMKYYTETIVLSKEEIYNMGNMSLDKELEEGMVLTGEELCCLLRKETLNGLEHFFFEEKHKLLDKWLHYFEAYERFFSK